MKTLIAYYYYFHYKRKYKTVIIKKAKTGPMYIVFLKKRKKRQSRKISIVRISDHLANKSQKLTIRSAWDVKKVFGYWVDIKKGWENDKERTNVIQILSEN